MHRIVLAGSVGSSSTTLEMLVKHQMNVVGVFGYEPKDVKKVSGFTSMEEYCVQHAIPYFPFVKINSPEVLVKLRSLEPDMFFVIGLSQLISSEMLAVAKLGNVGFHPTKLPAGRGRAPLAWLVLEEKKGASNFFLMGEGADDGPVFVQKEFDVDAGDTVAEVGQKIDNTIRTALDEWLPQLKQGIWNPVPQDEAGASYYGKRSPEDGFLNWYDTVENLDKLIHASAPPHPGAYTFLNEEKLLVLSSDIKVDIKIKGVAGNVLLVKDDQYLVQAGNAPIWIAKVFKEDGTAVQLKVGQHLGYYHELEIYKLKKEMALIKAKLEL